MQYYAIMLSFLPDLYSSAPTALGLLLQPNSSSTELEDYLFHCFSVWMSFSLKILICLEINIVNVID